MICLKNACCKIADNLYCEDGTPSELLHSRERVGCMCLERVPRHPRRSSVLELPRHWVGHGAWARFHRVITASLHSQHVPGRPRYAECGPSLAHTRCYQESSLDVPTSCQVSKMSPVANLKRTLTSQTNYMKHFNTTRTNFRLMPLNRRK